MKRTYALTFLLTSTLLAATLSVSAQEGNSTSGHEVAVGGTLEPTPVRKWYWSNGLDAALFSTSVIEKPGFRKELSTLRFSYFVNFGFNFNYDFDEHFGLFTGLGIKNIGLIEKIGDSTIKRRLYTIGAPLGFKLGNLQQRNFGFIGGGLDVPFNYREKGFTNRRDKTKMNEWFSDRTDHVMPYLFAGMSFNPGWTVKLQYYTGNFFNQEYEQEVNGVKSTPFRGYNAHLLYISIGMDIHYKKGDKKGKETDNKSTEM